MAYKQIYLQFNTIVAFFKILVNVQIILVIDIAKAKTIK